MDSVGDGQPTTMIPPERASLRIFISYRQKDSQTEVDLLFDRLVRSGFRAENIFRDISLKPGVDWEEAIERSLGSCHVVLAVIGPHWVEILKERLDDPRDWVRRELEVALGGDTEVIPVVVAGADMPDPDRLPPSIAPLARRMKADITRQGRDDDTDRLVGRLDEIASRPIRSLRKRNEDFTGRERVLAAIEAALESGGNPAVVAIVGYPGFGKTQVAIEYAHRHEDDYRILWEIAAERATTRAEHFAALARELRLPVREGQDVVEIVREELERTGKWLLIFDNADPDDDLRPVLPRGGDGHVIVTSQLKRTDLPQAATIDIDALPDDEATAFVMHRLPAHESTGANELARELQGYPLALEQAVAYIQNNDTSTSNYIAILREQAGELLDTGAPGTYHNTVMGTWRLAFDDVARRATAEDKPGAVELLNLCAFLDPDGVRLDLLREHADELPPTLADVLRGGTLARTNAVGLLARYSHVRWTADNAGITMHRTVQRLARERLDQEDKARWAETAVRLVLSAFPADPADVRQREACREVLPHAVAALEHAKEVGTDPVTRARLLDRVGVYSQSQARFAEAKKALEQAFNLFVEASGFDAAETATAENHLAALLRDLGDYENALRHHEAALRAHIASCGAASYEVAQDRVDLARTLIEQGDFARATIEFEQALRLFAAPTATNYRAVADCESGLFGVFLRTGNIARGKKHLEQAVAVYEHFQPDHPEATFFRYVHDRLFGGDAGQVLQDRLEGIIELATKAYGPEHPEVAEWTRWLADDALSRHDLDQAAAAYEEALEIDRKSYGRGHVKVGRDLFNAFAVLAAKGETDEAREALAAAAEIFDAAKVADVAFTRFDEALDSLGVNPAAVEEMHRVAQITRDVCGDASPLTASAYAHLAAEAQEAGLLDHARTFAVAALDPLIESFGANDMRVARCYALLGSILFRGKDVEGARNSYEHALSILDSAEQANQIDLIKILTGLYPVLAVYDEHAAVAAAPATTATDGNELEAAALRATSIEATAPTEPEAPAVLERAIAVAEETAAIGPLVDLCDAVLHPAGRFDKEEEILSRVLGMVEEAYGADHGIAVAILSRLALVAVERGELDRARDFFERALAIDDRSEVWQAALSAGTALLASGSFAEALDWHMQVVATAERRHGPNRNVVADALNALGDVHLRAGDPTSARSCFERALAIHLRENGGDDVSVAVDHADHLSPAFAALGDVEAAGRHLEEGLAIIGRSRPDIDEEELTRTRVERWLALGDTAVRRGDVGDARRYYDMGREIAATAASAAEVSAFQARLAAVAAASGARDEAIDRLETSARLWVDAGRDDPYWALVRMCAPAVPPQADLRSLNDVLRLVREEGDLEIKTFRPKIRAAVPGDWFEKESMTLLAPDGQANVIASSEPLDPEIDIHRYAEVQGELLEKEFPGYREVSFEEADLFGGRRGYMRHFEWSPPDGVPVTQIQAYYVEDGRGYTATATTPSSNFPNVELELRQVLSGLRLVS